MAQIDRDSVIQAGKYADFGEAFLDHYLQYGLGSMSKRQLDLLVQRGAIPHMANSLS